MALYFVVRILQVFVRILRASTLPWCWRRFSSHGTGVKEDPRKVEFLSTYKEQYGYPAGPVSIDELRAKEFARLKGEVYLDHAGATLYAESQIVSTMKDMQASLYGNPHSQSGCSERSSELVFRARQEILQFFNAREGEYSCVFTSGATSALKLVGESFPWNNKSAFLYCNENHNSVLGIREYALAAGATAHAVDIDEADDQAGMIRLRTSLKRSVPHHSQQNGVNESCHLFALSSECNFSGSRYDLGLIPFIQNGSHTQEYLGTWLVLVDAAKGCGTSPLDLTVYSPDFVAISFYKIFGYPTGLGALLVRNDAAKKLQKRYFGGGTVAASVADGDFVRKRDTIEQWFEDGTVPFLSIASLHYGFAAVNHIGISNISMHAGSLAKFTALQLSMLRHNNGGRVCILYGKHDSKCYWGNDSKQGPVVTFNLMRSDGSWIGHKEVEKLASLSGIHLRTGCFCNPGACSKYLGLSSAEIIANHEAGHVCWDDSDIIGGRPAGAVRVSFGYMSSIDESLELLDFIKKFFVDDSGLSLDSCSRQNIKQQSNGITRLRLDSITIYPIKSCGGFSVHSWPLGDCGLLYDREWLIVSIGGDTLTQNKCPLMCRIGTYIDRSLNNLFVTSPTMEERLEVPLTDHSCNTADVRFELCGTRSFGKRYEGEVAQWFTKALALPCTLVRRIPTSRQVSSRNKFNQHACGRSKELSFANEGQFLLVSHSSVEDLNHQASTEKVKIDVMRFRPNFVVSGGVPFEEDSWQSLVLGHERFKVLGGCNRCQMINIDQNTGKIQEGNNPLLLLASYRRSKGKILFGVLLVHDAPSNETKCTGDNCVSEHKTVVSVGCPVYPERIPAL